jgi:hypothetical protein
MRKPKAAPKKPTPVKAESAPDPQAEFIKAMHGAFVDALKVHSAHEARRKNPKLYWVPAEGRWKSE